jgi:16S rRNA (cytosine967-C5)-methyltransferase
MVTAKQNTASTRLIAVKLLTKNETTDEYIDHLLEASPAVKSLSAKDRALLLQIVSGVLKNKSCLDLIIAHYIQKGYRRFPVLFKNILRTAFFQLAFLQRIPDYAVVSEAVRLAKQLLDPKRAKLVNAVLRNYLRAPFMPELPDSPDIETLAAFYSHPGWIVERFVSQHGAQKVEKWLRANNEIPALYVRALREPETVANGNAHLQNTGLANYFKLTENVSLQNLPAWREGELIVQDPSAGLVIDLCAPQLGESVIDLCAAPGGKALALARTIEPDGHLQAVEISELRARKLRENIARTGLKNITVKVADARRVALPPADLVLVDAPCSGFGVLRRRADLRWKRKPEDFPQLIRLQEEILAHAAELVKPGGRLVYATCSIDKAENEEIAHHFLQAFPNFKLERAENFVAMNFSTPEGYLKTLPHLHGFDGMFAARLKRHA